MKKSIFFIVFLTIMLGMISSIYADVVFTDGFETGNTTGVAPVGWTVESSGWVARSGSLTYGRAARTGTWYCDLVYNKTKWMFKQVSLTSGTAYSLSLWAKQDATSGATITLKYGASATSAGMTNSILPSTNVSNSWLNVSGTFTPTTTGTFYIGILGTTTYTPWYMWIDDVSLESLTNPPNPAGTPSPADLATGVSFTPTLSWSSGGGGPTGYDVYFGTDNPPATMVSSNQAGTTYVPGTLLYTTPYYWKIVPRNANGPTVGCPVWSFTTGPDPTLTELPFTESFDGTVYPPYGWTHIIGSGASGWQRSTGSSSPTVSPYAGAAMLYYNSFSLPSLSNATLISPPIEAPRENHMYKVSFWMYRENAATSTADKVEVYVNSSASATGATLVGTVNRSISLAPAVVASGWYEYTFEIGQGGDRAIKYVLLKAISAYGNNMNVDEVTFFSAEISGPPNPAILTSPSNAGTNVAITSNLVWASGGGAPTGYKVYLGLTSESMELVSTQAGTEYDPATNFLFGKTYYWQVDPYNESGDASSAATLPLWSFSTASGIAITPSPAHTATSQDATNRTLGWAAVAGASGYKVIAGTSTGASDLVNMAVVATNSYVHTSNWPFSTQIFWKVITLNGAQEITGTEWSFTTGANPTLTPPFIQDFAGVTFPPTFWTRWSGELANPSVLTSTTSGFGRKLFGNTGADYGTAMNIYTTGKYWLVTPPIDLGGTKVGYNLEVDAKLTAWGGTATGVMDADDYAAIVISTDGTWSTANVVKFWNQANPLTSEHVSIPLDAYTGLVKIGFYGASGAAGTDLDLFFDNIQVSAAGAPPSAPTTFTPANNATNVAINTNLSWAGASGAPTGYKVYFGTAEGGLERVADLEASPYDPAENFLFGTTYSWYVTAYNDNGEADGATISFTTTNGKATTPVPANNATNYVASLRTLGWTAVAGASGYKIKIGTTTGGNDLADMVEVATNSYTHATNWEYGTQYFWTVYTMNGAQMVTGDEWNFTIGADPTITLPYYNTFIGTNPVSGWIVQTSAGVNNLWSLSSTNNALGGSPELKCTYQNIDPGTTRIITAPVDATDIDEMTVKFRHMYDWFDDGVDLKLQISSDTDDWTDLWSLTPTGANVLATEVSVDIASGLNGIVYFAWYISGNLYNTDGWFIDNIKFLLPDTQINQTTVAGGIASTTLPGVDSYPTATAVNISGLDNGDVVNVVVGYNTPDITLPNSGLNYTFSGSSFAGSIVTITHNLGFIPEQMGYRILPNAWNLLTAASPNVITWTATQVSFTVAVKADGDLQVVFPEDEGQTLPVSLSSFTAVLTSDMFVNIAWVSESETNHLGYNLLRNEVKELATALMLNKEIINVGEENGSQISYLYSDKEVYDNTVYYYWLESVAIDGGMEYAGPITVTVGNPGSEPPVPEIPIVTALMSAYPNPFNPQTNLRYSMKEAGAVRIEVYNVKGQMIRSFKNAHSVPGYYSVVWDGKDAQGSYVSSGVYFYRMTSGKYSATRKMMLMK